MKQLRPLFVLLAVAAMVTLAAGSLSAAEKININTASVKELTQLERIGPALAKRIVKYREENGPFEKPEDITTVRGIGSKTLRAFSDRITVGEPEKKAAKTVKSAKKDATDKAGNKKTSAESKKSSEK